MHILYYIYIIFIITIVCPLTKKNNCLYLIMFCLYYFTELIEDQLMVDSSKNINFNYI